MRLYEVYMNYENGYPPKLISIVSANNKEEAKEKVQRTEFNLKGNRKNMKKYMNVISV